MRKNKIDISVIMPVFNGEKYVREAIDSILIQTFKNFEFIIVDDASVDSTSSIIHSYTDTRIVFLLNEKNIGNYPSRNRGMNIARGRYICVMDADDVAFPERLEKQCNYLDVHPELLAVGSDFIFFNNKRKCVPVSFEEILIALLNNNCFLHPSLMIRSDVIRKQGGYNEKYVYSSDYDLMCRLSLRGKIENMPNVLMMYRWHKSQISQLHRIEQNKFADEVRRQYHRAFINCYKQSEQLVANDADVSFPEIGQVICFYTYARYTNDVKYQKMADDMLEYVYQNVTADFPVCLERGLCGLGCGLVYLLRNGFVDGNEDEILEEIDSALLCSYINKKNEQFIDRYGWLHYLHLRVFEKSQNDFPINNMRLRHHLFYILDYLDSQLKDRESINENILGKINELHKLKLYSEKTGKLLNIKK